METKVMETATERLLYQQVFAQFEVEGNRLPTVQDLESFVIRNIRTGQVRLTARGSRRLLLASGVSGLRPEEVRTTENALFLLQLSAVLGAVDRTKAQVQVPSS